jgi:4-amino-4-deoxy-L-arabinose transferase-like glycosyltransferase
MELPRNNSKALIVLAVMLVSAITSAWMLGAKPLGDHESYVAVAAREMLQKGDWIIPTYNGELRLQKTPLSYWLVASVAKLTGRVDEVAARLPSVLCAILSVGAILYFVSQWLDFRTAVMSALMWSTSLAFVRYGHSARPEMALTCFVTIAFLAFYTATLTTHRKKQTIYMVIFWTSFSLAMLAKGPAPLPLILAPLFLYFLLFRRWNLLPKMLPITGTTIFLVIVLAWPVCVAARLAEPVGGGQASGFLEFWKREFVDRFMGSYVPGNKPFYYYSYVMFQYMLPWAAFVPIALAAPFYRVWGKKRETMLFLWLWFVADVAVMSISGGKRMHYILPAMPAMAILASILFEDMVFSRQAYTARFARNLLLFHAGAVIAGAVGIGRYDGLDTQFIGPTILIAVLALIALGPVLILFARKKNGYACVAIFAGYCVLLMVAFAVFLIPYSSTRHVKPFARNVAAEIPSTDSLTAYHDVASRFVHYFGRTVPIAEDLSQAYERYQQGHWILATGRFVDELTDDGRFEQARLWENAIRSKGRIVAGALFHKPNRISNSPNQ